MDIDNSEGTFGDKRVCFLHLYFGYTAPATVYLYSGDDSFGTRFNLHRKYDARMYRDREIPRMMGFAYVDVASYARKDSQPESFHGMVQIVRQKEAKMVIRVETLHRAAHVMLVDESTRDPASAEYIVNNLVDGYHYWEFY